jgi:hypothetical protein
LKLGLEKEKDEIRFYILHQHGKKNSDDVWSSEKKHEYKLKAIGR